MAMDWYLIGLAAIVIYLLIVALLKTYLPSPPDSDLNRSEELVIPEARQSFLQSHITFFGPILALKTENVAFFDWFRKYSRSLRLYGSFGVVMVVVVSVVMFFMILQAVNFTIAMKPEPTAINKPQNIFFIPGLNEFIPSTFAVWLAFILTLVVHEFGHAILCRVEKIKVKAMGVLFLVIPIGAFVEPDEDGVKEADPPARMRMYGAGIMNNLVVGFLCFALLLGMIGWAQPVQEPIITGYYKDYPAADAKVPTPSIIRSINGTGVDSAAEITQILNRTKPGDHILLGVEKDGSFSTHELNLSSWPGEVGVSESGFMGVVYYNGEKVIQTTQKFFSPIGILLLMSIPFQRPELGTQNIAGLENFQILGFDTRDTSYYHEPFPLYWQIIHLLYWGGFINLLVGFFNALPMIPLDGGLIFREGIERLLARRGLQQYGVHIVSAVSSLMLVLLVAIITLPILFHL
jgi:membrane-associated protease RseP (regulator of RpoE activity)